MSLGVSDTTINQPNVKAGAQKRVASSDDELQGLLTQCLRELKKLNIQAAMITNNEIKNIEVENG